MSAVWKIIRAIITAAAITVASAAIFVVITALALGKTVFNEDYMKRELADRGIYDGLAEEIKLKAKGSYLESEYRVKPLDGVVDAVLDFAVTPEPLQKELEYVLSQVYSGEKIEISGKYFVEDYSTRIHSFLTANGIGFIERDTVEEFVGTVADNVKRNVDVSEYTNKISEYFNLAAGTTALFYAAAIVVTAVMLILILIFARRRLGCAGLPFLIAGALALVAAIVLPMQVNKTYLLNDTLTGFLRSVVGTNLRLLAASGAGAAAIGLALLVLQSIFGKKRA